MTDRVPDRVWDALKDQCHAIRAALLFEKSVKGVSEEMRESILENAYVELKKTFKIIEDYLNE